MTDEEKLIKTRNLVRHIIRLLDNEIDAKSRTNSRFFFDLMKQCSEVEVIKEDRGRYILTDKEAENWHRKGARHHGRHYPYYLK